MGYVGTEDQSIPGARHPASPWVAKAGIGTINERRPATNDTKAWKSWGVGPSLNWSQISASAAITAGVVAKVMVAPVVVFQWLDAVRMTWATSPIPPTMGLAAMPARPFWSGCPYLSG